MIHPKIVSTINSGKAVDSAFEGFWDLIKPKEFPANQPIEMRKAWFCGAFSMMELMTQISEGMDEEKAVALLDKINRELRTEIKKFGYPFKYKF